MEKRSTAFNDESNYPDAPDRIGRVFLLIISSVLIIGIAVAAVMAVAVRKREAVAETSTEATSLHTTKPTESSGPSVIPFDKSYPDGSVPTDCMELKWGMYATDIKIKYPDAISEGQSNLADEKNTVNITYARKAKVGGFDFSHVVLSTDRTDGLYAFSYLLEKEQYDAVLEALTDEYGKPKYKSGDSAYWDLYNQILLYLTVRVDEADGLEHTFLQYIHTKDNKSAANPDKSPVITLGMTVAEVRKRKLSIEKIETAPDGTETYMSSKIFDVSSDTNLGKFAPGNATAILLYFDPRADLISYSFVIKGDHLYEVREKLASEYGSPAENRDFSSQWNTFDGKATITVSYGRMNGSGRDFATEIRYSATTQEYRALEMIKAVGRAAKKGLKYAEVKDELGKYNPSDKVDKKGNGTMTLINSDNVEIIVFGVRIKSLEIEFAKNRVSEVYYVFDGGAYKVLKRNIETNYGGGESKYNYKDRIHRVLWKPKNTDKEQFSRLMLDYVNLKVNPKARVHYYG